MRQKPVGEPAATAAWNFGTPRRRSSLKRLRPFCYCRQRYARSLRRIHASRLVSIRGVWQKPKYPRHPRRYGARSSITCGRLFPRVRRVMSRICALNLASAFGAMRRSLPSFAMLNPGNLRSSGRATALFASLTFSFSLLVRNRLTEDGFELLVRRRVESGCRARDRAGSAGELGFGCSSSRKRCSHSALEAAHNETVLGINSATRGRAHTTARSPPSPERSPARRARGRCFSG